jgi:endonuclease I
MVYKNIFQKQNMRSVRQISKLFEPVCIYSSVALTELTFSTEHLLPKSKLKTPEARLDLRNIFPCDIALNLKRSNYSFVDGPQPLVINHGAKTFVPSLHCRGIIARTCMHMHTTHGIDLSGVIDESVLSEWLNVEINAYEIRHTALIEFFKKTL